MSVWHSPTPAIRTRTSPGPGSGTGMSWYSGGRSHLIIRNAVIVAIGSSSQVPEPDPGSLERLWRAGFRAVAGSSAPAFRS